MRTVIAIVGACAAWTAGCGGGGDDAAGDAGDAVAEVEGGADGDPDAHADAHADTEPEVGDGEEALDCAATGHVEHLDQVYRVIDGVNPNLLSLDVYEPVRAEGCPAVPLAIWVHGGGWSIGDKSNQMADKVALFESEGWVLASVNYRLSPTAATTDPEAVRYPLHNEDVTAAIVWLRERAATWNADPGHILVFGHSAGAGIVSQIATNERFLGEHGLGLDVLRCAAMLDTEAYDVRAQCEAGTEIYLNAFGTDPAVWDEASALSHVAADKGIPPCLVLTRGTAVREALSAQFVEALEAAGIPTTLVNADPLTHAEVNDAVGAAGDTIVTPPLMAFFRDCVR